MFSDEVLKALEFIDYSLEKGFENACIKFRHYLNIQSSSAETGKLLDYWPQTKRFKYLLIY